MKKINVVKTIEQEIKKIETKKNKILFFVFDTKGAPHGSLEYIYETAFQLREMGYNAQMLHAEKEFIGVESWLGEKYAKIPHFNVEKDDINVSPSDLLIIPEMCVNVMTQTKELPCKRILLLQNFSYLTEMMPMGVSLSDLRINECITITKELAEEIKTVFPYLNVRIVKPSIPECFFKETDEPKKLIINVISKDSSTLNAILKPFYWKYPNYSWVAFREVKNLPREDFANALREGIATIWADDTTNFGYSALEAMACHNIVIGKVPSDTIEWMTDNGELRDNGVWFFDTKVVQDLIASTVQSFLTNNLPEKIFYEMVDTVKDYNIENQKNDIEHVYVNEILEKRKEELQIALDIAKKNNEK